LALNSGEWFFRFFILDHFFHHAIHLNDWSEFPRPPLQCGRSSFCHPNKAKAAKRAQFI
jgi:hypothetical protein